MWREREKFLPFPNKCLSISKQAIILLFRIRSSQWPATQDKCHLRCLIIQGITNRTLSRSNLSFSKILILKLNTIMPHSSPSILSNSSSPYYRIKECFIPKVSNRNKCNSCSSSRYNNISHKIMLCLIEYKGKTPFYHRTTKYQLNNNKHWLQSMPFSKVCHQTLPLMKIQFKGIVAYFRYLQTRKWNRLSNKLLVEPSSLLHLSDNRTPRLIVIYFITKIWVLLTSLYQKITMKMLKARIEAFPETYMEHHSLGWQINLIFPWLKNLSR